MSNQEMRQCILSIIEHAEGIKSVDLAMKVMEKILPTTFEMDMYWRELGTLVENGDALCFTYVVNDNVKSFYLPRGTEINP